MNGVPANNVQASVLAQLLLMQSVLCGLPDERSIFGFTCRGLSLLPGVTGAHHAARTGGPSDAAVFRFPITGVDSSRGDLVLEVSSPEAFAGYVPHVRNFVAMVALILDERAERAANRRHREELATVVEQRTVQLTSEIAERREMEHQLQRSRDVLEQTLNAVPQAIFWKDGGGRYIGCNRAFATAVGYGSCSDIEGKTDAELPWRPEDVPGYLENDRFVLETGRPKWRVVEQLRTAGGDLRWIETTKVPLLDAEGRAWAVLGVFEDITDRRRAEQERESLQNQLAQAQKMESVGRLAGGVAHDFNNMLQAILGNASLALLEPDLSPRLQEHIEEILKAAERSASLTQQLLAFARKQTVAPQVLDLNQTVSSMLRMLQRLIGEDIRLQWQPAANLWPVRVDPVQIDQVLANLVVNARDAISGGGRISISTGMAEIRADDLQRATDLSPGEYVTLTIEDSGCGLSPEARAHLFEPFFTTKPAGKGTGLGLATVYGIVKQNQGAITVRSAPGAGTAFTIFFPRSEQTVAAAAGRAACAQRSGSETLLLVEDEEQILTLAKRILELQGYNVLAASAPLEAIRIAEEHAGPIQLLITDVVMPQMSGSELYNRVVKLKPGLRCIFMSGYTSDVLGTQAKVQSVAFQSKPFTPAELTERVRQALDQRG